MTVTVQYFAVLRERLGRQREDVELAEGATVADLRAALSALHPEAEGLLARVVVALDREYAGPEAVVRAGSEVALIPPIAGGAGGRLSDRPLALDEVIRAVWWPGAGGLVTFSGVVRDESRGRPVTRLEYEAYAEMAEEKLAAVEAEVRARWPAVRCALRHRVGALEVGETAVVIAVAAAHRKEAFAACEFAIDHLKETVPLWKKETGVGGATWVEECVPSPRR